MSKALPSPGPLPAPSSGPSVIALRDLPALLPRPAQEAACGAGSSAGPAPSVQAPLRVINLFGSPGQGKSTVRAGLFWLLKTHQYSVEEVAEFAKYLCLSNRKWQLRRDPLSVLAEQNHRQDILRGRYRFAISDSPLMLCDFYAPDDYALRSRSFSATVEEHFAGYDNVNFFLSRDLEQGEFETEGRDHDKAQSLETQARMREFLDRKGVRYKDLPIDILTPWRLAEEVLGHPLPLPKAPSQA